MHIFFSELISNRKSLFLWSIGMATLLFASMFKFDALIANGDAFQQVLNQFPSMIQALFGMNNLDVFTLRGYYGVLFLYVGLMAAIHAGLLGTELLTKEPNERTTEFLYVKPISRWRVITEKLLAGLLIIALFNLATGLCSIGSIMQFDGWENIKTEIGLFTLALLIIQLVFFSLGAAISGICQSPKLPAKLITSFIFLSYLVYVFAKIAPQLDWLKNFSPFLYFDAFDILNNMALNTTYVITCIAIILLATVTTYYTMRRRDLTI